MLGFIASTLGGVVKDLQVGVTNVGEYLYDEVCSIPSAFESGYDSGIISGDSPSECDHHVDVIEEEHPAAKKFGKAS